MKRYFKRILAVSLAVCIGTLCCMPNSINVKAEKPIVKTMYTADPSPIVVGDTLYTPQWTSGGKLRLRNGVL